MMQATLIYNPQAGRVSQLGPDQLLEGLRQAGYDAVYSPTETQEDLDEAIAEARDLVVVAGGDGSIRAAAIHLLGRDVPITPLPMGTANNIARMLGLTAKPLEIIAGLTDAVARSVDIGRVETPQGLDYFLEAMGTGMFAEILDKYKPEEGKSIPRSIQTILQTVSDYQPKFFHVNMDGQDFSGHYLLLEVMNTPTLGFHFALAPEAQPDDGLFDLVLIHASERADYLKFITGVLTGTLEKQPDVSIHRGRRLQIAWRGFPLHLDEKPIAGLDGTEPMSPSVPDEPGMLDVSKPHLQVELVPGAVHFLVPRSKDEG